jgi:pimeloyl-ACP methyl ester carboxylesterase
LSAPVVIWDEDAERAAVSLQGVATVGHSMPGQVTRYTTSARAPRTDGRVILSQRVDVQGVLEAPTADSQVQQLVRLRDAGTSVAVQIPGRPGIGSLVVESIDVVHDATTLRAFRCSLVERRLAQSRRVSVEAPATRGAARADLAAGLAGEADHGDVPVREVSIARALLNSAGVPNG